MTHLTTMTATHALDRIAEWQTALRAENKSATIFTYAVYHFASVAQLDGAASS